MFGVLAAIAALAVAAVVTTVAGSGRGGGPHPPAPSAESLDLTKVSAEVASHYRYAQAHSDQYQLIPCWCGCEQFLGHRNLADCFVRSDGKGWEAHAAGCGVCITEAVIAERMLGEGATPLDVKNTVDAEFGTTAITAPRPT